MPAMKKGGTREIRRAEPTEELGGVESDQQKYD